MFFFNTKAPEKIESIGFLNPSDLNITTRFYIQSINKIDGIIFVKKKWIDPNQTPVETNQEDLTKMRVKQSELIQIECFLNEDNPNECRHDPNNSSVYYTFNDLNHGEKYLIESQAFAFYKEKRYYSEKQQAILATSINHHSIYRFKFSL